MRPIKFRVWDEKNKKMIYEDVFSSSKAHWMTWDGKNYRNGRLLPYTMLQFTGLLDKNGKEIYEGDVLSFVPIDSTKFKKPFKPFVVRWVNEDARFSDWSPRNTVEVIGNIYENPELLEVRE